MILTAKVKKSINIVLRIIIVILALWFIYDQITQPGSFNSFRERLYFRLNKPDFTILFLFALFLMPVNWGIEAYKWRKLIGLSERISFADALKSVFTGISMSLFTPNRIGEFLGRSLTLKHTPLLKGALLTITGSISQLLTTIFCGILALLFFIPEYYDLSSVFLLASYIIIGVFSISTGVVLLLLYLRVSAFSRITTSIIKPSWQKIRAYLRVVRRLKRKFLIQILLLSISRYLVFTIQFYLLIQAFGLKIALPDALMLIAMIYFVMAAIPTVALVDLGIRGSVSIYFLGLYFGNTTGADILILTASTFVWIINLAIPALIGLLFINRLKVIKD